MRDVDIVVIGAGAAGIGAGLALRQAGADVCILEARDRVGGRAETRVLGGYPNDLGCGWLHSADDNAWVDRMEAKGFAVDRSGAPWERQRPPIGFPIADQAAFHVAAAAFYERAEAAARHAHSFLVPDGVEVRHFVRTGSTRVAVPNDINFVPRPVLGYFGAVDDRLDYALILALAEANPNWSIVMVGPVCGVVPENLPRRNNIYWIGYRPYGEMPDYAFGFQVAIAPYLVDDRTRGHASTKLREYVMSGRPVVCTALPDAREQLGEFVTVAASTQDFIDGCHRALGQPDADCLERGRRALAKRPWKSVAATMEARIEEALARRQAG